MLCVAAVLLPLPLSAAQQPEEKKESEIVAGNYGIRQSVEVGYRFTDFSGSRAVYNTFVNLRSGPRLLEQSLEMRSINHKGGLFDSFSLNSFGFGGEPNTASRLRISKDRWYNFNGSFRRDHNFWDYNLLANPLNPTTSNPTVAINSTPHHINTGRRLTDLNLTILPQSKVRFRLGYFRNSHDGPSFSSFHEGTEILLFQPWKTLLDSYQMGVDIKLPHATVSYDQSIHFYKQDTSWQAQSFGFQLSNGTPVDLGLIFNTASNQPCRTPVINATTNPPTADPTCNGYLEYTRLSPGRTRHITEQVSFQSRFSKLDLSGRASYSSSSNQIDNLRELFRGLVSRSLQRQFEIEGASEARRVSVTADLGMTWRITDNLRVADTLRFNHFRIPSVSDLREKSFFGSSMITPARTFDPSTCPPPFTGPGCPVHGTSSPADNIVELFDRFLGQRTSYNLLELQYDANRHLGGRLGYRLGNREIVMRSNETALLTFYPTLPNRGSCAGQPLAADGTCRVTTTGRSSEDFSIHEHSLVFGVWARAANSFRLNFDLELMSSDNAFTRISPRHSQRYRLRGNYNPQDWINLAAHINILERRNNVPEIHHLQHNRSYGFNTMIMRGERFALDLSYNFEDIFSQTNICFVGTLQPVGSSPCPTAAALFQQNSLYDNLVHYGSFGLMFKPQKKVSTSVGYSVVNTSGQTLILNPNQPPGTLQYNYFRPYASLSIDLASRLKWIGSWGYYDYFEKGEIGPTGARDFQGNLGTISLRYSF
jgi:hypothetical protein